MRTITLHMTQTELEQIGAVMHDDMSKAFGAAIAAQDKQAYKRLNRITPITELRDAIGYLSVWALPDDVDNSYNHCVIRCADTTSPELVACYYPDITSDKPSYVIGAIWHGDHFGFHS